MNRKLIVFTFFLAYALMLGSAFAQPQTTAAAPAVPDQLQSVAGAARDDAQDQVAAAENARIEAEVRRMKEQLALQQSSQLFWLQVLQTLMPVLSGIGIAVVAYLQVKAARERQLMAQSINGMKTELVAQTRAAAFFEGAHLEREKDNPDTPAVVQRGLELSDEARKAGEKAQVLAAQAAGEKPSPLIGQPPATPPASNAPDTPPKV